MILRRWLSLLEDYSDLKLTFETDIFPALSGLVKEYQRIIGTEYLAGLWNGFVLPGLLWHVQDRSKDQGPSWRRPGLWRAPTWLWVLVKGPVSFVPARDLIEPCEVVGINCQLAGPDSTGELTGGQMVLRGLILSSTLHYRSLPTDVTPWNLFDLYIMHGRMGNVYADYNSALNGPSRVGPSTEVACFRVSQRRFEGMSAVGSKTCPR